jgi:hypothetical protein
MRRRKNPEMELADPEFGEVIVDTDDAHGVTDYAPWYKQLTKLDDQKRKEIIQKTLLQIKESNSDMYKFIKNNSCELVGICPEISYVLCDTKEGDTKVTFVHGFSMPTLLFWCERAKFAFFINPVLEYNDTVLNKQRGNKPEKLQGFTG